MKEAIPDFFQFLQIKALSTSPSCLSTSKLLMHVLTSFFIPPQGNGVDQVFIPIIVIPFV